MPIELFLVLSNIASVPSVSAAPLLLVLQGKLLSALLASVFAPEVIDGVSCPACAHAAASRALTSVLIAVTLKRATVQRSASNLRKEQEDHADPDNEGVSAEMVLRDSADGALEVLESMSSTLRVRLLCRSPKLMSSVTYPRPRFGTSVNSAVSTLTENN